MNAIRPAAAAALLALLSICPTPGAETPARDVLHHELVVRLDPAAHRLEVTDRVELPATLEPGADGAFHLALHAGLSPVAGGGWRLEASSAPVTESFFGINAASDNFEAEVPLEGYRLYPPRGGGRVVELRYGGVIDHPLQTMGEEYQRSFSETPGQITEEGVFLSGTSFWVPRFGAQLFSFSLRVEGLPPGWDVVSQGGRTLHEQDAAGRRQTVWDCPFPTEEIYLVAGPWTEYSDAEGETKIFAFLRSPDPALAARYIKATKRYLQMYESLLPSYPFPSFSLVENYWETGYGMPGFTLLGQKIIRFPWILSSSYPHEILHNWWGNSIYVDPAEGNWCEGLTAYMADHLFAEQRGEGALYRRATLKKFTDMVRGGEDVPLTSFRSRHSAASEAVGYGKSMMLFHMARQIVGDADFIDSLRLFARRNAFSRASLTRIANEFTEHNRILFRPFFLAWASRTGAPELELGAVDAKRQDDPASPWLLEFVVRQRQAEDPFPFALPVAVTVEGREEAIVVTQETNARETVFSVPLPARPLRIDVDPAFDVMRRLDPFEVPPALSTVFGEKNPLFVLPSDAGAEERAAWEKLARDWRGKGEPRLVLDSQLEQLPSTSAWILGWSNRLAPQFVRRLAEQGVEQAGGELRVGGRTISREGESAVLVARSAEHAEQALAWVAADPAGAIPGLGRKLPHYTRYSWLSFRGDEPENSGKGLWTPLSSPLVRFLDPQQRPELSLPPRPPLAQAPASFDSRRLARDVGRLADPAWEGRGLGSPGLEQATAFVEQRLAELGLEPVGSSLRQSFTARVGDPPREMNVTNLIARLPAAESAAPAAPVLVMAHLDHLGRGWPDVRQGNEGKIHPGADDNASGVAALLELARTMAAEPRHARPVIFAVVSGEEAGRLGSRHLATGWDESSRPMACVNLDTVGRLGKGKLLVLDASSAKEWRYLFMGVQYTTGLPISIVGEPLDSSDQVSCIEAGVPAVQLFTGPNTDYHRPTDTAEKIDVAGLTRVVEALYETVTYLADREEPLHASAASPGVATAGGDAAPKPGSGRKVSLGTLPDFAFPGPGVRVEQVIEGSPAARAGLLQGDLLIALDGQEIADLRSYSAALKAHQPGDEVSLTVRRGDAELTLRAVLAAR